MNTWVMSNMLKKLDTPLMGSNFISYLFYDHNMAESVPLNLKAIAHLSI